MRATGRDSATLRSIADLLDIETLKALIYWLRDRSGLKPQSVARFCQLSGQVAQQTGA
jgi:hypothetical protein